MPHLTNKPDIDRDTKLIAGTTEIREPNIEWLSKISQPTDLKSLNLEALEALAQEIRQLVAFTCSSNGGHFAPSLGVVEMTIALHYVYNAPEDRIVWDVGHQAYPHKILTGRYENFHTLRSLDGISGFPKRSESPYDAFGVGHASTAISAALGMALAFNQQGKSNHVVAICGDGAMTGGLCYEALNNLGYLAPNMLVILNDNEMSISPNIGAMSHYFNQVLTTPLYNKSKATAKDLIKKTLGERGINLGHRIQTSLKDLIVPEETFFEKMGIRYLGPVDGHNLTTMIDTLQHVRDLDGPILLHVKTVKGKGYSYSESDPELWHSGANFEVTTGAKLKSSSVPSMPEKMGPSYTETFSQTLLDLAERDPRITAITAAMPSGTGLSAFAKRFPERFYDVGIAEAHAACSAAGMACEGLRPVVAIYSTFLQRAFDNVIHDVALQKLPVTFAIDRAGLVGEDGPTHHGVFDLSFLRIIPGLVLAAPRDRHEMQRIMHTAAAYEEGPFAYRYPRGTGYTPANAPDAELLPMDKTSPVEIGKGEIIREPSGNKPDVAILSIGTMAHLAMAAAQILDNAGISTAVVDMRFVQPLDTVLLRQIAEQYDHLVTLEENVIAGGFGSCVNEAMMEMGICKHVLNLGLPNAWVEQGPVAQVLQRLGLDPDSIARRIQSSM